LPRKRDIEAAVAAYNDTDGDLLLPPATAHLLSAMFGRRSVWQGRLEDLVAKGFDRRTLPRLMRALVETGFLSTAGERSNPPTYRLHLPPRRQP
jgi:hypothetical protein